LVYTRPIFSSRLNSPTTSANVSVTSVIAYSLADCSPFVLTLSGVGGVYAGMGLCGITTCVLGLNLSGSPFTIS
jgi:hypothetical protein